MAIKKILTDLNTDGNIGLGKDPEHFIDIDKTSVANDETRGINIELSKENTSGAGFASNVYGVKSYAIANSSEIVVNIGGVWSKAEHTGSGQIYYATGGTNRAYHSGSGNSSSISGTFSEAKVGGTGSGDHSYVVGLNSIAKLDNPNATVDFLQGQHCTVQVADGEVTDNVMSLILDLDHTGGTISGDFEYLRIQNDTFDSAVGGTARAINSLSTLRSEFAGTIQSPRFDLGSSSNYLRENSGDVELYGNAAVKIESGDGMLIEMSDVIDITGGGDIVSDSSITATSIIKSGGASTEFLKADGSVDTNTYLTSADVTSSQWDDVTGGINYASGNVGIGTTSPNVPLEVNGNTRFGNSATGIAFGVLSTDVYQISGADVGFTGWNSLHFKANSSDGLFIEKDTNNVGIGTTAPSVKLHVDSASIETIAYFKSTDNRGRISIADNDTTNYVISEDSKMSLGSNASLDAGNLTIDSDGNVGIGTTSPSQPLHIDLGTVDVKAQLDAIGGFDGMLVDGTNASYNLIGGNGDKYSLSALNDGTFRVYNEGGAGYSLTLNNSGKLGIGTTNPQEKLDISAGDIRLDDQYSINWATDDANIGRVRISGNEVPDTILFATDNSERIRITNSGTGIGTSDPQARLDVDGGIRMGNDTQTPASTNVGTMRYYADAFGSYADMIMQTDTSTYGWVNVVRNTFSV